MKTALVTGAAGGMGLCVVKKLVKENYRVIAADIKPVEMENVSSFLCDVTCQEQLEKLKKDVLSLTPSLDVIVHTAGIYDLDSLVEIEDERFLKIFEINLFGVFRINRLFTPVMKKGGRIAIVTSELAPLDPLPFTGIYAVTKSALEKYAYALRLELMLRGIHVGIIRPGAVRTGLLNISTASLERFCAKTKYYKVNAKNFKNIVDRVEAKSVPPEKVADRVFKFLSASHPRYVYNLNRNPLLRLMSLLPDHVQTFILSLILK